MPPKGHAKGETDVAQLKMKLETEPMSKSLTGTVIQGAGSLEILVRKKHNDFNIKFL